MGGAGTVGAVPDGCSPSDARSFICDDDAPCHAEIFAGPPYLTSGTPTVEEIDSFTSRMTAYGNCWSTVTDSSELGQFSLCSQTTSGINMFIRNAMATAKSGLEALLQVPNADPAMTTALNAAIAS